MPYIARLTHTDDLVIMDEFDPGTRAPRPLAATFLKLKLAGTPTGVIDISYDQIANYQLPGPDDIETVVNGVLDGTIPLNWRAPVVTPPSPSRLSLRNDIATYFVFILEPGNYRFSTDAYPFRIEGGKSSYHYEARCVWPNGAGFTHARKPPIGVEARAGYFIAFSNFDLQHSGNQAFRSNFNIYLDLDYAGSAPVPISVDPDVGYPGGNS